MAKNGRLNEDRRRQMIAQEAFLLAERRGFGGDPVADWIAAEAIINARLDQADCEQQSAASPQRQNESTRQQAPQTGSTNWSSQLDEQLALANERLRALRKKLADASAGAREELTRDIERLAKLRDRFRKKRDEIRRKGEDAGDKARQQSAKIWQDITAIIDRVKPQKKTKRRD